MSGVGVVEQRPERGPGPGHLCLQLPGCGWVPFTQVKLGGPRVWVGPSEAQCQASEGASRPIVTHTARVRAGLSAQDLEAKASAKRPEGSPVSSDYSRPEAAPQEPAHTTQEDVLQRNQGSEPGRNHEGQKNCRH